MKRKLFEHVGGNAFQLAQPQPLGVMAETNAAIPSTQVNESREEDLKVIQAMEQYGGGFIKALAAAAKLADPENLERIKKTWPEYWQKYSELAQRASNP